MSTSDQQQETPAWGAPTPAGHRPVWSTRKVVIAVVVAVVLAGGGGAAIAAAATGSSSGTSTGPGLGGRTGGFGAGMGGPAGMGGGLADVLHGDFIAANGSGYRTERLQTGKVTSVGSTALTVASTDGYTSTYVIGSATEVDGGQDSISTVKTGDTVTVTATVSGNTATATSVLDRARMQQGGAPNQQGGQPPQGGPGGN